MIRLTISNIMELQTYDQILLTITKLDEINWQGVRILINLF